MLCKIVRQSDESDESHVDVQAFVYPELTPDGQVISPGSQVQIRETSGSVITNHTSVPADRLAACEEAAYQRGVQDTEAGCRQQLDAYAEKATQVVKKSISDLMQFQKHLVEESEKQVAELALQIAKKIVRREVRIDDQIILAMIKVAMSYVSDARKLRIRVNPEDLKSIRTSLPQMMSLDSDSTPPELIGDPAIERGGFVMESESGIVDARLGQQFQEIEKGFFGLAREESTGPEVRSK